MTGACASARVSGPTRSVDLRFLCLSTGWWLSTSPNGCRNGGGGARGTRPSFWDSREHLFTCAMCEARPNADLKGLWLQYLQVNKTWLAMVRACCKPTLVIPAKMWRWQVWEYSHKRLTNNWVSNPQPQRNVSEALDMYLGGHNCNYLAVICKTRAIGPDHSGKFCDHVDSTLNA